jgi:endonuclease-3
MKNIGNIVRLLRKDVRKNVNHILRLGKLSAFEILIGTILSQRTRDANTAKACNQLFSKYKTVKQMANANLRSIQKLIKPAGFYKVKAKRIKEVSKIILKQYNGNVPKNRKELLDLPGVGHKTSGIVMVYGYGAPETIPVDTHVHRISNRLDLIKTKSPEQSEEELIKIIPKRYWIEFNDLFVRFGQQTCLPRGPKCTICPISNYCEYRKRKSF